MKTLILLINLSCLFSITYANAQVGIGTTTPQEDLHVVGNVQITNGIRLGGTEADTGGSLGTFGQTIVSDGNGAVSWEDSPITVSNGLFKTGNDLKWGGGLSVNTSIFAGTYSVTFHNSTNGAGGLKLLGNGDFNMDSNTLFVDASENKVGIGTASPSQKLDVNGAIQMRGAQFVNFRTTAVSNTKETFWNSDYYVLLNRPMTLPDASDNNGRLMIVVNNTSVSINVSAPVVGEFLRILRNTANYSFDSYNASVSAGGTVQLISDGNQWHAIILN